VRKTRSRKSKSRENDTLNASNSLSVPGLNHVSDSRLEGLALDRSVLGSSQLSGCKGDFCTFDLSFVANDNNPLITTYQKETNASAEFRRSLMTDASSMMDEESSSVGKLSIAGRERRLATSRPVPASKTIPFRIIIQARQEMPLVNRLLRKIKKGEINESPQNRRQTEMLMYVTEDTYSDLAISGKLPSHYYQDVPCCETCFKVYKLITDARTAAIAFLERKKDATKVSKSRGSANELEQSTDSVFLDKSFVDLESSVISEKQESLSVAVKAIECLSKLDVAEIRTLSKPPAAVTVVMEAVIALLTGKVMSVQETRRLLGGGEAFLLMLREFRLENITDARLKMVEPYVDNPLFRPENVQPVSFCASKFCAWVLGVVQAARWQRGMGHTRTDFIKGSSSSLIRSTSPVSKKLQITSQSQIEYSSSVEDLTFVQKLEKKKAKKQLRETNSFSSAEEASFSIGGKYSRGDKVNPPVAGFSELNKKLHPSPANFISRASLDLVVSILFYFIFP
jgi:hypothetical protein